MAMQVLIAHTGQRLELEGARFTALDDFKTAVARSSSIPNKYIIALTPQGKPLKPQSLASEKEIYVYDSRVTQARTKGAQPTVDVEVDPPARFELKPPPNHIADTRSLQSWQELFANRAYWSNKVTDDCTAMAHASQARYSEMDAMMRCLDAAVANLESVVGGVQAKYKDIKEWATSAQVEQEELIKSWEGYLELARSTSTSAEMVNLMTGRELEKSRAKQATLEDLLDPDTVNRASKLAPQALRKFSQRISELDKASVGTNDRLNELTRHFERIVAGSAMTHDGEAVQLLQDLEAIAKKIDTDSQATMQYSSSTRDVLQASKIAATHTERLLPSIVARAEEMDEMVRYATTARNSLALESIEMMRNITNITSASSGVKTQITQLHDAEELSTFDYLRLIQQVPYMYASFVVEAIRRREWFDKVRSDSSTLANDMAVFQDEETKRRKKWQKSVEDAYGPQTSIGDGGVPGLEINLHGGGEDDKWPNMTKEDMFALQDALQQHKADQQVIGDVAKLMADLSNPTKQQSKRLKAFKNGSMHEAGLGRSGLLIRGDDDMLRSVQEEKAKVDGKLKTAESRVRRLEDLLHRQSQASRPSIGTMFQQQSQNGISTPTPTPATDESLRRVQQLEEELNVEKQKSIILQRDLDTRTTEHKDVTVQMADVNSTKKDLLENLEALKREFVDERKSLEDEIKHLKARIEDTEDEIEHFGESREHEKLGFVEKVQILEEELAKTKKDRLEEAKNHEHHLDLIRTEAAAERRQRQDVEKTLHEREAALDDHKKSLAIADENRQQQLGALREIHTQVAPDVEIPESADELIAAVTSKSSALMSQMEDLKAELSLLKSERETERASSEALRHDISELESSLATKGLKNATLSDDLAQSTAKVATLEQELDTAKRTSNDLRAQLSRGETGSESLRQKLDDDEKQITNLKEELAARQSHISSIEEQLQKHKTSVDETHGRLTGINDMFRQRTEHAKDLTQRLYSTNERLIRLLERLGFSVSRNGSTTSITKLPRQERSMQNLSDTSDAVTLLKTATNDDNDLELLQWTTATDKETEISQYEAFISAHASLDMDTFSETIYRRVKDIEHMARKLQRESRANRDKAHSLQKEAHEKIAYKSFKEGDLALFLPTRNQTTGAWAAFNIGFPHYFLREQESHRLRSREWLLARIGRVQERVVDLSKNNATNNGSSTAAATAAAAADGKDTTSIQSDHDNPFDLSDGLRWYLIDAHEDKPGAPITPGLAKATVAATNIAAVAERSSHSRSNSGAGGGGGGSGSSSKGGLGLITGHGRGSGPGSGSGTGAGGVSSGGGIDGVSKSLSKSLESRRSSTSSRKVVAFAAKGSGLANAAATATATAGSGGGDGAAVGSAGSSPMVQQQQQQQQQAMLHPSSAAGNFSAASPAPGVASTPTTTTTTSMGPPKSKSESPSKSSTAPPATQRQQHQSLSPPKKQQQQQQLQRDISNASTVESPSKKSVVWDSLWSYDVSFESKSKSKDGK